MTNKFSKNTLITAVLSLILLLAACTPVSPAGQVIEETTPVPPSPSETPVPEDPTPEPQTFTIFISSETAECVGVAPQQCLIIRYEEDGEWEYFYDSIDGFEFVQGYSYELLINRYDVENPPADASSFRYELVEIKSKVEAPLMEDLDPLAGTIWNLIGYGDPENLTPPVAGAEVTIDFQSGQAGGRAACNFYGGTYTLDRDKFKWNEPYFNVTAMLCEEPLNMLETEFLNLLAMVERYTLEGNQLTFHTAESVLVFETPENAELEATDWTLIGIGGLRTYLDDNITARFEDGTMSGSGGCNGYSAGYELSGNGLTFGPALTTLMACEQEIMDRESEFHSVLPTVASFKIERNTLYLLDADGTTVMSFATGEIPES